MANIRGTFDLAIIGARPCQVVEALEAEDMKARQLFGMFVYVIAHQAGYFFFQALRNSEGTAIL